MANHPIEKHEQVEQKAGTGAALQNVDRLELLRGAAGTAGGGKTELGAKLGNEMKTGGGQAGHLDMTDPFQGLEKGVGGGGQGGGGRKIEHDGSSASGSGKSAGSEADSGAKAGGKAEQSDKAVAPAPKDGGAGEQANKPLSGSAGVVVEAPKSNVGHAQGQAAHTF